MATFNLTNQNDSTVNGTTDADTVNLAGNGTRNSFNLSDGNDTITGADADYITSSVSFGFGDDSLTSGIGSNSIVYGNQGQDTLDFGSAASGIDVFGGQGNDTVTVTAGTGYLIYGNLGDDVINLNGDTDGDSVGSSTVYGGQGADSITGSSSGDIIFGGQGLDSITTFGSGSMVYGNLGDDVMSVNGSSSSVFGGQGSDTITVGDNLPTSNTSGFVQNALIYGNLGDDTITLTAANSSSVYGGQGSDTITIAGGTQGAAAPDTVNANNTLFAGDGDDVVNVNFNQSTVDGGAGDDIITAANNYSSLTGGADSDQFNITGATVQQPAAATADAGAVTAHALTITDFVTGVDKISLGAPAGTTNNFSSGTVNGGLTEALASATGTPDTGLAAGDYEFIAGTNDGFIFYNAGMGTGATDANIQGATLSGLNSISDFHAGDLIGNTGTTMAAATPVAM